MAGDFRVSLAAARVNANMTQDDVVKAMGISKTTLVKWENGITIPTADKAEELSKLYNCPLNRINFCRKGSI